MILLLFLHISLLLTSSLALIGPVNHAFRPNQSQLQAHLSKALLISSFSDGLAPSSEAKSFLSGALKECWSRKYQTSLEQQISESAQTSPCCGPTDLDALDEFLSEDSDPKGKTVRFLFIPSARYALRLESTSTPGKQRQRARADGKKRRNAIVQLLQEILGDSYDVDVCTVDFHDGSVKHAEGNGPFPIDGDEALSNWDPHFVYVDGGNTFWLHYCMNKYRYTLMELLPQTVFCGASAGAILVGQRVSTALWKGWDDPRVVSEPFNWEEARGLDLIGGYSIFPHASAEYEALVASKREQQPDLDLWTIRNDEVLCVDGKTMQRMSSDTASMQVEAS